MAFKIGLLGLGTVGAGTAQILLDSSGRNPLLEEIVISQVGVRSLEKTRPIKFPPGVLTTDLEAIVTDPEINIVVELLGGLEPARALILQAIDQGKHVVTANKAVIARHGDEIYEAANCAGVYVLLEASVGGGIPIIKPLKQSLGANRITSIIGIVNGTTNYILTKMTTAGADFNEVLIEAQQLGYAEADPTADVDGLDAADKIAILASLGFGGRVKRESVYCEGIRKVSAVDIAYADKLGFVIKLLAIAKGLEGTESDTLQLRVHPTLVPKSHPLANVDQVNNAILVEGDPLGQVMFYGPGAGAGPTASAVVSDIINIVAILKSDNHTQTLDPLLSCIHQHYCQITPIEAIETRFYVRFLTGDVPGVIGHLGTSFGNYEVSLESVVQIGFKEELAEIVVVTHYVCEGNFRTALDEVRTLEAIKSIPSVLRVL
ncbi:MAG: homoserine dehydrogenase [cyanobacterium endosymbiont of Rhopalodia musculus]|uniref:homoserine dehydrogenase n=1 Tax=cyanobacterium endosymbiont of Epithemia clementina EcSB TaxID=3034674 RepID=UPI00248164AE|nr:homoserine dehydrogenase [cyanobacterium endosymbiont of Epithemia clementina EcSB]WGT68392.1 homoserine dehydrogenase [cyanobacterium endosymbiont of Epithemia clementina EcSB]